MAQFILDAAYRLDRPAMRGGELKNLDAPGSDR